MGKGLHSFCTSLLLTVALLCCSLVGYADELIVNNGTSYSEYAPVFGYYVDDAQEVQTLVLASELSSLPVGAEITAITYYLEESADDSWYATFELRILETADTLFTSMLSTASAMVHASLDLDASGDSLVVVFDAPYEYGGDNLVFDWSNTSVGDYARAYFYGVTQPGGYSLSSGYGDWVGNFSPKMKITYSQPTSSCSRPASFSVSDVDVNSANFAWTAGGSESSYLLTLSDANGVVSSQVVAGQIASLSGLAANTNYTATLAAICAPGDTSSVRRISFRTDCGEITIPWKDDFSSYSLGTTALPCYLGNEHMDGYNSDVFKVSSFSNYGPALFLPYMYPGDITLLTLPVFDVPAADAYEFKISITRYSGWYEDEGVRIFCNTTELGFISDNYEVADEEHGIPAESEGGWYTYSFTLPAGLDTIRIQAESDYGSFYIDNLEVRAIPSCRPSKDLSVSSVSLNNAVFSWNPANGEEEWLLRYKNSDSTAFQTVSLTSPSFEIENLNSSTIYSYDFRLFSVCDGALSPDSACYTVRFCTECAPLEVVNDTIKLDFEYSDAFSQTPCYSTFCLGEATPNWQFASTYRVSGSYSLCGFVSAAGVPTVCALPMVSLPEDYEVFFYARQGTIYPVDSVEIYVNTQPSLTGATLIKTINDVPADAFLPFRANIPLRDEAYLLIKVCAAANYAAFYVDDLSFQPAPSCAPATYLHRVGLTGGSVSFAWTPGGSETAWNVTVEQLGDDAEIYEEASVEDTPEFTLEGLNPQTSYTLSVSVVAVCGEGNESEQALTEEFTFLTPCLATSLVGLASGDTVLFVDFENSGDEPFTTGVINAADHACWVNEHVSGTGSGVFEVTTGSTYTTPGNATQLLRLPDMSAGTITRLSLPPFDFDEANAYELVISVYRPTTSYAKEGLRLFQGEQELGFISRNYTAADAAHGVPAEKTYGWYTYSFILPLSGAQTISIQGESQYGSATYADNLLVRKLPSCRKVKDLSVKDVTTTTANIVWSSIGSEEQWQVLAVAGTDTLFNGLVSDTVCPLSGLTSGHVYSLVAKVSAVCSEDDQSEVVSASISFATECEALTSLPWAEDFESHSTLAAPVCWEGIYTSSMSGTSNSFFVYNNSTYAHGEKSLVFSQYPNLKAYTYAILPEFDIDFEGVEIYFNYKHESLTQSGKLDLGYLTDVTDSTTFVLLASCTRSTDWVNKIVTLGSVPEGARLAFRYGNSGSTSSSYGYYAGIDDIQVRYTPTCFPPTNLHMVDSLAELTSLTLAWSPYSADNLNAKVFVTAGTDTLFNGLVSDSVLVLSGLNSSSVYSLKVTVNTVCDGELSTDALQGSFTTQTLCEVISASWSEGFENKTLYQVPVCWTKLGTATYPYVTTGSGHTGTNSLYFYGGGSYSSVELIVSPEVEDLNTLLLSLWYTQSYSGSDYASLEVGYVTNPSDASTFVLVQTLDQVTGYTEAEVAFTTVPNGVKHFAIRVPLQNYATTYYVDDLQLQAVPTCLKPKDFTAAASSSSSIDFAWTPQGEESAWCIRIYDGASTLLDSAVVSSPAYTWSGLQANHRYTGRVAVQAICSEEDWSDNLEKDFSVRTDLPADVVVSLSVGAPFVADFADADEQASWVFVDGVANNFIFGTDDAALTTDANGVKATVGLYVSDDNSAYNYDPDTYASSAVYRTFHVGLDSAVVAVSFQWQANGESGSWRSYDYGRAFVLHASATVSVADKTLKIGSAQVAPGTYYETNEPASALANFLSEDGEKALVDVTTWQQASDTIQLATAGDYNLLFGWGNDGGTGSQYPLAVGDVHITLLSGSTPTSVDDVYGLDQEGAVKFIRDNHVFISCHGVVYDALGQKVEERK